MNTTQEFQDREVEDFYIAQVNSLVADGREALIPALAEEYRLLCAQQVSFARTAR